MAASHLQQANEEFVQSIWEPDSQIVHAMLRYPTVQIDLKASPGIIVHPAHEGVRQAEGPTESIIRPEAHPLNADLPSERAQDFFRRGPVLSIQREEPAKPLFRRDRLPAPKAPRAEPQPQRRPNRDRDNATCQKEHSPNSQHEFQLPHYHGSDPPWGARGRRGIQGFLYPLDEFR